MKGPEVRFASDKNTRVVVYVSVWECVCVCVTDVRVRVCVGKGQSEQERKKGYETDNMAHLFYVATQTLSSKPKTKSAVFH